MGLLAALSAADIHARVRCAGFNLYGIDEHGGIASIEVLMVDASGAAMRLAAIIERRGCV